MNILILCFITVTTKFSFLVCWRALMVVSVVFIILWVGVIRGSLRR